MLRRRKERPRIDRRLEIGTLEIGTLLEFQSLIPMIMKKINKILVSAMAVVVVVASIIILLGNFLWPIKNNEVAAPLQSIKNTVRLIKDATFFFEHSSGTYLFILQNSDEMRPTGGFIGTYGLITVEAGRVTNFFTDDVYNLDQLAPKQTRPSAPEPIRKYLEQPYWYLRDANWSPDFPTSAKQILKFYEEEAEFQPKNTIHDPRSAIHDNIAGVIAIDPEAIRPLLKLVGPIEAGGQIFNADNLTDLLEYEVEIGFESKGISPTQRKEIISELGYKLIAKVMDLPLARRAEVVSMIQSAFNEKHILAYARDAEVQATLESQGWSGSIKNAPLDYFAVFDANMFAMKTDPYVQRNIFYNARKKGEALIGELEIVYTYPKAGPAWKTKGYRTWTRVYVPKGSILQKAYGAMEDEQSRQPGKVVIDQEFEKTVFGAFVALQVGEEKHLKFIYRLPNYINQAVILGNYELFAQKQPGTLGHNLTITLDIGKVAKQWTPSGAGVRQEGSRLIWKTNLQEDLKFSVKF